MKSFACSLSSLCFLILLIPAAIAQNVTLSSSAVAAANITGGTSDNIVYVVKMDVAAAPVSVNTIQFTLTGTHDDNDLDYATVYFNAVTPALPGATQLVRTVGNWAAPHTYVLPANRTIPAGESGYFIITVDVAAAATNGNTVKLDGAVNPVVFGYTTVPAVTNNQTDAAGTQTIQVAGITLTTISLAAAAIMQGSNNNPVYIVKMDAAVTAITVNSIQFTLTGTYDNNDLALVKIFFNDANPTVSGATFLNSSSGLFAAPHTYIFPISETINAGASGYLIIAVDVDPAANTGNTIKLNGAANPVSFGYSVSPTIFNNQADLAGTQSISSILPLSLVSFTGNVRNTDEVQLQWMTATELNTKSFAIEWSDDGSHFTTIAIQPAAGNSLQNRNYSYLHKLPADGNNYYRLKMTDIDGHFTYSPVIKLNVAVTTAKIIAYPNPVTDLLQLQVRVVKNETIVFYLHSADGKMIVSKSFSLIKGSNRFSWPLPSLVPGNYFIYSGNNLFKPLKIIKD